jgi:tRNA G18 (ribose-2'-O)-methylase SpoU
LGNERLGVSEQLLKQVQHTAHIEMFGANSSMNVAQATAIALYELTKH